MPPFQFQPPPRSPSLADLLMAPGLARARAAEQIGAAQAQAALQSGQAWGQALGNIGQAGAQFAQGMARMTDPRLQLDQERLNEVRREAAGRRAVAGLMQGDQLAPEAVGPRQQSYLDTSGLFDISKITQALGQSGYGDLAPDLVKGAEAINTSILTHQRLERETAQANTVMIGDLADGALKLAKTGTPLLDAMDFVVQPALATKRINQRDYLTVRNQIADMPPERQQAALTALMDQAAQVSPTKNVAEGALEVDRYGRVITKGQAKSPTEASLAADLSSPDPEVRAKARTAIDALKAQKRSETDQALDAYAKALGKTKAEDLTDAERQAYAQRQATIASNQGYFQHMRERQYDIANPIPEKGKSQDALEQEYRTVLRGAMSNRSGGIGLEDQKVQQANHLLELMRQYYDPKTGSYSIPPAQYAELSLGLARLVSPGGSVGIQLEQEIKQASLKGDFAKALTYITGIPVTGSTQAIFDNLRDSIQRQGEVAEQNREGHMGYLRSLAPTDLEGSRRIKMESGQLNPLRRYQTVQNAKGERRVIVSLDGGKTWQ